MIDPDIWHDTWFGNLTDREQIFFVGIISNADDEGRILANPTYLRSRIFVYRDVSIKEIENVLGKFRDTNVNFILYSQNGNQYIQLAKWSDYQKPQYAKPSKLPPPPPDNTPLNNPPNSLYQSSIVESSSHSANDSLNDSANDSLKKKQALPEKRKHGEFQNVLLTEEENGKLLDKFGEVEAKERIERLSSAIASKGYKYASHYATILNWKRRDDKEKGNATNQKRPRDIPNRSEYNQAPQYDDI